MASMPQIGVPGTALRVSRFVFGTGSLFKVGSQKARLALLHAAVDAGFTHFDTAPYYGFGWAEQDLGLLFAERPGLTVTSKVGLYSPGGETASYGAVFLRKAVGRFVQSVSRPELDFSLHRARSALEASLRRLRRSHIELYMLHEPELPLVATDEWQRWLEEEVRRGRIGTFGLALERDRLLPFLRQAPGLLPVVQTPDSLDLRQADCLTQAGRPLQITHGYVSAARQRGSVQPVADILAAALARTNGAIIVSTTRKEHMKLFPSLLEPRP